jgi:hypothetical protein
MRVITKTLIAVASAAMVGGCVVREDPYYHRHHEVVYTAQPEVVYTEAAPAAPVEVVPAAPGPDVVWVEPVYVHVGDHWVLHHGYYRHR